MHAILPSSSDELQVLLEPNVHGCSWERAFSSFWLQHWAATMVGLYRNRHYCRSKSASLLLGAVWHRRNFCWRSHPLASRVPRVRRAILHQDFSSSSFSEASSQCPSEHQSDPLSPRSRRTSAAEQCAAAQSSTSSDSSNRRYEDSKYCHPWHLSWTSWWPRLSYASASCSRSSTRQCTGAS